MASTNFLNPAAFRNSGPWPRPIGQTDYSPWVVRILKCTARGMTTAGFSLFKQFPTLREDAPGVPPVHPLQFP